MINVIKQEHYDANKFVILMTLSLSRSELNETVLCLKYFMVNLRHYPILRFNFVQIVIANSVNMEK